MKTKLKEDQFVNMATVAMGQLLKHYRDYPANTIYGDDFQRQVIDGAWKIANDMKEKYEEIKELEYTNFMLERLEEAHEHYPKGTEVRDVFTQILEGRAWADIVILSGDYHVDGCWIVDSNTQTIIYHNQDQLVIRYGYDWAPKI